MSWTGKGDAVCDDCGAVKLLCSDRELAIQMLLASSWNYASGFTLSGGPYEMIRCTKCAHEQHKRRQKEVGVQEDVLPLDWEEGRKVERGQGFQSR